MTKNDLPYLQHIRDAIDKIIKYLGNLEYESFMENDLVQDAIIRQIEILGEATKQLSEDFRQTPPQVKWKSIAGMRDKLIHGYMGVDLNAVWDTVNNDIPRLKKEIKQILSKY